MIRLRGEGRATGEPCPEESPPLKRKKNILREWGRQVSPVKGGEKKKEKGNLIASQGGSPDQHKRQSRKRNRGSN